MRWSYTKTGEEYCLGLRGNIFYELEVCERNHDLYRTAQQLALHVVVQVAAYRNGSTKSLVFRHKFQVCDLHLLQDSSQLVIGKSDRENTIRLSV